MSRIGRLPISIPQGVKVALEERTVRVEGPKGKLTTVVPSGLEAHLAGNQLRIGRQGEDRKMKALHGLARKLVANMVEGVSRGFTRVLEINGVGYRAEVKG